MAGCYGKIPSLGDFLSRNLPATFVEGWDGWLRRVMAGCAQSGGDWSDRYLGSPIWRFVLSANAGGGHARAGILVPSVDRIGRCFPLTILESLPNEATSIASAMAWEEGYERAEMLALGAISQALEPEVFIQRLADLPAPWNVPDPASSTVERWRSASASGSGTRLPGAPGGAGDLATLAAALALPLLSQADTGYSIWWHFDWEERSAATAMFAGLPPAEAACAMLLGASEDGGCSV